MSSLDRSLPLFVGRLAFGQFGDDHYLALLPPLLFDAMVGPYLERWCRDSDCVRDALRLFDIERRRTDPKLQNPAWDDMATGVILEALKTEEYHKLLYQSPKLVYKRPRDEEEKEYEEEEEQNCQLT